MWKLKRHVGGLQHSVRLSTANHESFHAFITVESDYLKKNINMKGKNIGNVSQSRILFRIFSSCSPTV